MNLWISREILVGCHTCRWIEKDHGLVIRITIACIRLSLHMKSCRSLPDFKNVYQIHDEHPQRFQPRREAAPEAMWFGWREYLAFSGYPVL